jgi:alpha-ribazole phosphatase
MSALQLMRHGATLAGDRYCGRTDVELSAHGWEQMRRAVAGRTWRFIVSSPLRRCAAFAAELAHASGARCRYDPDLREMCFGRWEGKSAAELMRVEPEALAAFWSDPVQHPPPGGESVEQLHKRVLQAWERVISAESSGTTLVITHGGPIRVLCGLRDGLPGNKLLAIDVAHATLIDMPVLETARVADSPTLAVDLRGARGGALASG